MFILAGRMVTTKLEFYIICSNDVRMISYGCFNRLKSQKLNTKSINFLLTALPDMSRADPLFVALPSGVLDLQG